MSLAARTVANKKPRCLTPQPASAAGGVDKSNSLRALTRRSPGPDSGRSQVSGVVVIGLPASARRCRYRMSNLFQFMMPTSKGPNLPVLLLRHHNLSLRGFRVRRACDVSVLCCYSGFVRHVAPEFLALSFKLKAETSISGPGIALPCNGADECQESQ